LFATVLLAVFGVAVKAADPRPAAELGEWSFCGGAKDFVFSEFSEIPGSATTPLICTRNDPNKFVVSRIRKTVTNSEPPKFAFKLRANPPPCRAKMFGDKWVCTPAECGSVDLAAVTEEEKAKHPAGTFEVARKPCSDYTVASQCLNLLCVDDTGSVPPRSFQEDHTIFSDAACQCRWVTSNDGTEKCVDNDDAAGEAQYTHDVYVCPILGVVGDVESITRVADCSALGERSATKANSGLSSAKRGTPSEERRCCEAPIDFRGVTNTERYDNDPGNSPMMYRNGMTYFCDPDATSTAGMTYDDESDTW
jgi:hypothetical protein